MNGSSSVRPAFRRAAHHAVDAFAASKLGSIDSVGTNAPLVALTFDDGPDRERTPQVLDVLAGCQARATFFMLVQNARAWPELVRRAVIEGHEVALHGVDHSSLAGASRRSTRLLIVDAAIELGAISGTHVKYFRPPFGHQTVASCLGIRNAGLDCVVWDLDSLDWRGGEEPLVASKVVAQAAPGSIVLLHDGCAGDGQPSFDRAKTVQLVLDGLQRRRLYTTTLSALCASGQPHRTVWLSRPHVLSSNGIGIST
jgi:peptidoglycan/xylan/chitin deacetylase (PgdA/CDA1 family)